MHVASFVCAIYIYSLINAPMGLTFCEEGAFITNHIFIIKFTQILYTLSVYFSGIFCVN